MSESFEEIQQRLEKLKIQVAVNEEKTKNSLQELQEFMTSIDSDFITSLSSIVPEIEILKDLTTEKIQQNESIGESLVNIVDTLKCYLEKELSNYERMM